MSLSQWEKRLARIEANNKRRGPVWRDPFPVAKALFDILQHDAPAVAAGNACWIPVAEPERSDEEQALFDRTMDDLDKMRARLTAKPEAAL